MSAHMCVCEERGHRIVEFLILHQKFSFTKDTPHLLFSQSLYPDPGIDHHSVYSKPKISVGTPKEYVFKRKNDCNIYGIYGT